MDGRVIDRALSTCPITRDLYRGVLTGDAPTPCRLGPGFYVYNTDEASQPGRHWVAQYRTGSRVLHFDSYGLPPFGAMRRSMAREECPVDYRILRLQGNGTTCGHYCLYYALHCADPYTYPMTVFDAEDWDWNDAKVVGITRNIFKGL